ncbi:MAG: bifunctional UDP-N-acetylglucosamine diphosphorylase/glucosamine-1-phosphate N-acetyltransferase GlmU [Rhodobacteraceae bacterium]|nr:bifunctional UDP-N-acetylglucosamine diphosphorylase/glucosamine-1-phosphate N-acetyltransferase GlmU [Paracoccaceae bacterium]
MPTAVVILAAGAGTRMNSDRPKALHGIGGAPLLAHVLASAAPLAPEVSVVVVGHGGEEVAAAARALDPDIRIAQQPEQRGTAHAVACAAPALAGFEGDLFVLYADTPLIRAETLERMSAARAAGADVVVLGFEASDPGRYGRLVRDAGGGLERIVEARDASPEELAIRLCNSGVICAPAGLMLELVGEVGSGNAAGELYLTDIVELARHRGRTAAIVSCPEDETLGVNSRADLARAEAAFQARRRAEALAEGVTLIAPETIFFAHDTWIGRDAMVGPNVVFGPGVTVETGAEIRAFCHLEGAHVGSGAVVGPFARLRTGAELGNDARVGNFVEIKEAILGEGSRVNHLSYIGDAEVGAGANVGAGTITCNYDGVMKHRTVIGARAFIGSNTALVAPVEIGAEAMTASGSVVTQDVPAGALALGRARQVNKPGLARALKERLLAIRARRAQTRDGDGDGNSNAGTTG